MFSKFELVLNQGLLLNWLNDEQHYHRPKMGFEGIFGTSQC
jgi:hypothetical protein